MSDHSFDRRAFVAGVLGAGGVLIVRPPAATAAVDPTNCTPTNKHAFKPGMDTRPITMRRTVEQLWADKAWLKKMDAGYKWMRGLSSSDPRSLTQQGNIHKIMCAGGPREVHGSDRFLAWHRCFVYFQERIVAYGSTGGHSLDPTFRLAVWDWEGATTTPTFPEAFKHGSLLDTNREPTFSAGDGNINPALATTDIFTFYGYPVGSGGGGSPVLENASHGQIHMDTGRQSPPFHDMGSLPTAALDPVFCAHHGNIDKVWAWWQQLHPGKTPSSVDPAWLKNIWYFYDYDGKCYSIGPADVIDYQKNLRYSYPPAPGTRVVRPIPLKVSNATLKVARPGAAPLQSNAASMQLNDVQIPSPGTGRFNLVANAGGKQQVIGHFALFAHPMEGAKASVLAKIEPQGVSVLQSGASFTVVAARGGKGLTGATPSPLSAKSAVLLLE
jgi:polyphenol oxidase